MKVSIIKDVDIGLKDLSVGSIVAPKHKIDYMYKIISLGNDGKYDIESLDGESLIYKLQAEKSKWVFIGEEINNSSEYGKTFEQPPSASLGFHSL